MKHLLKSKVAFNILTISLLLIFYTKILKKNLYA